MEQTRIALKALRQSIEDLRTAITHGVETAARPDNLLLGSIAALPSTLSFAIERYANEIRDIEGRGIHKYTKNDVVVSVEISQMDGLLWVAWIVDGSTRSAIAVSNTRPGIEGNLNKLGYVYTIEEGDLSNED